jgi:hypothetical protein
VPSLIVTSTDPRMTQKSWRWGEGWEASPDHSGGAPKTNADVAASRAPMWTGSAGGAKSRSSSSSDASSRCEWPSASWNMRV